MQYNIEHIFIFRSNVITMNDKLRLQDVLDMHPLIEQWSVDMEDADRIVRIISSRLDKKRIMELIAISGYSCHELEDQITP